MIKHALGNVIHRLVYPRYTFRLGNRLLVLSHTSSERLYVLITLTDGSIRSRLAILVNSTKSGKNTWHHFQRCTLKRKIIVNNFQSERIILLFHFAALLSKCMYFIIIVNCQPNNTSISFGIMFFLYYT